jgi:hypothetical protein
MLHHVCYYICAMQQPYRVPSGQHLCSGAWQHLCSVPAASSTGHPIWRIQLLFCALVGLAAAVAMYGPPFCQSPQLTILTRDLMAFFCICRCRCSSNLASASGPARAALACSGGQGVWRGWGHQET